MPDLRFPIGKFAFEGPVSEADLHKLIDNIEQDSIKPANSSGGRPVGETT